MINTILSLLRSDGYITVHKTLIKNIGLVPAALFAELCSKYKYFLDEGLLQEGYFYYTLPNCQEELGLSRREQDGAFNILEKLGLIEKKAKKFKNDAAPKRYIKITQDFNLILGLLQDKSIDVENIATSVASIGFVQNEQIEMYKTDNSICAKRATNKNNNIIINNKNNSQLVSSVIETVTEIKEEHIGTNELTDELNFIFEQAQVEIYNEPEFKAALKETIQDAFGVPETRTIIKKLKLENIDTAVFKFREAQEQKQIKNPKLYFQKCLISAIREEGLNNLFIT